jgi:hypothetical protein
MAPNIAHRRALLGACSRILEPEHWHELGLPVYRSLCGSHIHKRSKFNHGQSAIYPRYVSDAWSIGIVSHKTRGQVFFRQPIAPIFSLPEQSGYGDKRPS